MARAAHPLPQRHVSTAGSLAPSCGSGGQGYFQHYSATEPISSKIPLWFETSPLRGKRVVDKTAKPMKSFSVPPPFREGQSARPLSVGCGVSRRMGRLWIETRWGEKRNACVDGAVREVCLCSDKGGNGCCRKSSMYSRPARLRLRAAGEKFLLTE